jgi:signal transduction histidine kinase
VLFALVLAWHSLIMADPLSVTQPHVEDTTDRIMIGRSRAPLYGPWRFCAADSPVDLVTKVPLWAEPGFDDSKWEIVDLTPRGASTADPNYVPGWTAQGHRGHWGYGWYRLQLDVDSNTSKRLALAGPASVDDAYEVYANGKRLGSFGDFRNDRPVTYYSQPMIFPLDLVPGTNHIVLAFRVWVEPNTLATSVDGGGLRSAPAIGDAEAITAEYRLRWLTLIRNYSPFIVNAALYGLLALVSFSLILFDRSDKVYVWIGAVFTISFFYSLLDALDVWTQHLSIIADTLLVQCFLGPLAYAGWVIVWWIWFGRRSRWIAPTAVALAILYMISNAIAVELFYDFIPHPVAVFSEGISVIVRLVFFALLLWIVGQGIRKQRLEGWLVLPAIIFLGIGLFQVELTIQHIQLNWFPLGVQVAVTEIANLLLVVALALLLLRRLLLSVRRQREIQVDAQRAQLQSDFVAAVSHEFRSPLTTLRSITDLLAQNRIEGEARRHESYVFLDRETARLQRLVEDLLDFGRMESNRKQYRMEKYDAFALVRATVLDFQELAMENGFEVEMALPASPAPVYVDEEALSRALRNLLENAMKYSPVCRTVWVDGSLHESTVVISVRDKGMGIDEEEKEVIFQKFARGKAAKRAGIKGTGIGLAMVRQIAEAFDGVVHLQSELGVSSMFTLEIPLARR